MTVKQLRELLKKLPDDQLVVLSKDSEGNGFSPMSENYSDGFYSGRSWCGEFSNEKSKGAKKAICFWPTT